MINVSDTITQQPIDFKIIPKRKTILSRLWLSKEFKVFEINPIFLGTLLVMAKNMIKIQDINIKDSEPLSFDTVLTNIVSNTKIMAETIAIAVINEEPSEYKLLRLFQKIRLKRLSTYFRKNLTSAELLVLINAMVEQMDITHFFHCIASMKGLKIIDPSVPKNPNQEETSGRS